MIGKLIQAYNQEEGTVGLFRIVENLCSEDYINTVIQDYFEIEDTDSQELHLMRWGIERIFIDFEVNI